MSDQTRRSFLKQAALGTAAVMAYPTARVLGANNRVRVGMIGVGDRGNDLLGQILSVHGVEVVAMADVYSRRRDQAKNRVPGIQTVDDHRRLSAAHSRAAFPGYVGRGQRPLFREDDDLVDS